MNVELMHPSMYHKIKIEENQIIGFEGKKNLHWHVNLCQSYVLKPAAKQLV